MKHKFPNLPFQEVNLKEERTMLETNMERWKQDWIDQGISQGINKGINRGKTILLQQMIAMKFPSADLSPYQHAIADAAEDELMQYSKKLFTATCVSEIFEQ
jgi:hypothetical protein